jgi:hypothetical protein
MGGPCVLVSYLSVIGPNTETLPSNVPSSPRLLSVHHDTKSHTDLSVEAPVLSAWSCICVPIECPYIGVAHDCPTAPPE